MVFYSIRAFPCGTLTVAPPEWRVKPRGWGATVAGWEDRHSCLSEEGQLRKSGTPWSNPAGYERQNPVSFVGRWKTPMLVIHGAKDYRIPESQGLGTFNALQRLGIPSKVLYFPDEGHWVLSPANSILWHETVIGWLDQWLK